RWCRRLRRPRRRESGFHLRRIAAGGQLRFISYFVSRQSQPDRPDEIIGGQLAAISGGWGEGVEASRVKVKFAAAGAQLDRPLKIRQSGLKRNSAIDEQLQFRETPVMKGRFEVAIQADCGGQMSAGCGELLLFEQAVAQIVIDL